MRLIDARRAYLTGILLPSLLWISIANAAGPKYGPEALPLTTPAGNAYFHSHAAPDFWALMPFYAAQTDDSACSVATVQMLVNAVRGDHGLSKDDELATQPTLVEKVKNKAWHRGIPGALAGKGVTLDELGDIARAALEAYGIQAASIEVVHADGTSSDMLNKLHEALVENEKSAHDFILINFNQGVYTGDAQIGHIAPIGAYDEKNRRALVLDPDRRWYAPYWVSEKTLLAGMATRDQQSSKNRGWVYIRVKP
ncbi:MAG: phytochelatin synthase family protein [Oligoflexia bacterium]|nr:phytochelatin synthase family protein [Oligoflexia bacterium]